MKYRVWVKFSSEQFTDVEAESVSHANLIVQEALDEDDGAELDWKFDTQGDAELLPIETTQLSEEHNS